MVDNKYWFVMKITKGNKVNEVIQKNLSNDQVRRRMDVIQGDIPKDEHGYDITIYSNEKEIGSKVFKKIPRDVLLEIVNITKY